MINRRKFIQSSLTSGAALPLASALGRLEAQTEASANQVSWSGSMATGGVLIPLPERDSATALASLPSHLPVRRVGQKNINEHDPAVKNSEEWADLWHSAQVDVVYVSVT